MATNYISWDTAEYSSHPEDITYETCVLKCDLIGTNLRKGDKIDAVVWRLELGEAIFVIRGEPEIREIVMKLEHKLTPAFVN